MKQGDEVVYSICINDVSSIDMPLLQTKLGISPSLQIVSEHSIVVPRLFTEWLGDEAEKHWQNTLRAIVGTMGHLTIDVQTWTPSPGYPKGEM
jgi:hypothetical protein